MANMTPQKKVFWYSLLAVWFFSGFLPIIHVDKGITSWWWPVWAGYFVLGGGLNARVALIGLFIVTIHVGFSVRLAFVVSMLFGWRACRQGKNLH